MPVITLERTSLAQVSIVSLATLLALALLSLVLAYWTWVLFAPAPTAPAPAAAQTDLQWEHAHDMFGLAQTNRTALAPTGIAIKLLGVVAAMPGYQAYAMVQLEGKGMLAVREGEAIAPGIRLEKVGTDHIIIERGGARETLAWPTPTLAPPAAVVRVQQ